ncbi:MFS transporter [Actinomadura harenae]|uniref:MFS transporter n=1 Tax=Actinomadura harenae TaxID=2483351 RepID=UPI0018F4186A|nr:MFS transporter [Actinomadura harenae]
MSPSTNTGDPQAPPDRAPAEEGVFGASHRALSAGVLLSVGMVAFESLGVATILPGVAGDLHGLGSYGWGLSALMLANIVGTVLAGRSADRGGPRRPMAAGMLVFAVGCAVAGAAPDWPVFLGGRVLQGLGVGAVMATAYTLIGLAYPERLQARMFALLSSAWTLPSLVGPVVAGTLSDAVSWRAVFVLVPPITLLAAALTLPAMGRPPAPSAPAPDAAGAVSWWRRPLTASVRLTLGTGLLLQGLLLDDPVRLAVVAVAGLVVAVPALRLVTPDGTLGARPGLGAGVAVRALLCGAYFGSEAFLPLGLQELRGMGATEAGLGLSAGAITWVAGSAFQARRDSGRVAATAAGFAVLLGGVVLTGAAVVTSAVPSWIAVLGWAVAGLGMGVAFNASTTAALQPVPAARQGQASAALQLAQTLSTALVAGLGGAAVAAAGHTSALSSRGALLLLFAFTALLALAGTLLSRRLTPR